MTGQEKRRKPRIDSHNLVSYLCFDEDNRESTQGIGRTLDVSEGGIRLETHIPMAIQRNISLTIGLDEDIMEFKGRLAYCKKREDGKFETGIEFSDMDKKRLILLRQYIVMFKGDEMA